MEAQDRDERTRRLAPDSQQAPGVIPDEVTRVPTSEHILLGYEMGLRDAYDLLGEVFKQIRTGNPSKRLVYHCLDKLKHRADEASKGKLCQKIKQTSPT
jgi:hypothetical protein